MDLTFKRTRTAAARLAYVIRRYVQGARDQIVPDKYLNEGEEGKTIKADLTEFHAIINVPREFWRDMGLKNNTAAKILIFGGAAFSVWYLFFR